MWLAECESALDWQGYSNWVAAGQFKYAWAWGKHTSLCSTYHELVREEWQISNTWYAMMIFIKPEPFYAGNSKAMHTLNTKAMTGKCILGQLV